MSIYAGTPTERDYRAGFDDGRRWAEQDANEGTRTYWLETFRAEVETFRVIGSRGLWAYYLGVLRGYRESTRTQDSKGEWGA